ncbi:MAG: alpha-L-arabinofuranosidase [Sphingobacteriales bacterium]|nr:MAG: alpha-L-arabinofuranosidase [Sphingobacteriales bacterium]
MLALQACKKDNKKDNIPDGGPTTDTGTGTPFTEKPDDPATANTMGFFLDSWQPKNFSATTGSALAKPAAASSSTVTVDLGKVISKVSPFMFGNNANPYMGQLVTEPVLMDHIKTLAPRIIRAPGGSLSDIYFFNLAEGQSPDDAPAKLMDYQGTVKDAGYWAGKNKGSWTCSIDNYYAMLQQTASTGILTVNYGYARYGTSENPVQAAAHLAAQWVRYDKGKTKYWEVGNENYGNWEAGYRIDVTKNRDGQPEYLTGSLYGSHFKVFADSMRKAAADIRSVIKIGAVLVDAEYNTNPTIIKNWNRQVLANAGNSPDFFVVHSYYTPYNTNAAPDIILPTATTESKAIADYIKTSAQAAGVDQKPIAMTEWNIFSMGSKQKMSNIAGVHAVLTMAEMHKANFAMAARWHILGKYDDGNDFATISSGDDPQNSTPWLPRPVFYYMYYYQKLLGDYYIQTKVSGDPSIAAYASKYQSGAVALNIVNKGSKSQTVKVSLNKNNLSRYYYYLLNGEANVPFSRKVFINGVGPTDPSGGPKDYLMIPARSAQIKNNIHIVIPPYGVVFLLAD